jgi:uncharacterized membrane protein YeaQ/YmgE (transglycosylase-associated protein family)
MILYIIGLFFGGLIIGAIGRLLVPGRQPMGCLATSLCGIGGSLVGGLIGRAIWGHNYAPGIVMAVLGAVLVIWVLYGTARNPRRW